MRKILLSMTLFLTVTSGEFETKKHRPLWSEGEPQFWLARGSRLPWDIKDKDGRHQESKTSLSRISGSQLHDLNRFLFKNRNLSINSPEDSRVSDNLQSLNELSSLNLNQERLKCTWERCRRRTQGWRLQEPLYVEEPHWVQIESESLESPVGRSEPFIVNRGKRSLKMKINSLKHYDSDSYLDDPQGKKEEIEIKKASSKKNVHVSEGRKKREISSRISPKVLRVKLMKRRSEADNKKCFESLEKTLVSGDHTTAISKCSSYLHPRNKHSDILEILEEPFLISRGKKNNLVSLRDFSLDDFYLDQDLENLLSDMNEDVTLAELELAAKNKILDKILNHEPRRKRIQDENKNDVQLNAKRGVLEELDLQSDPFYVARG